MVEEHMLVNKHKRSDASTLSRRANQMHYQYRTMCSSTSVTSPPGSSTTIPSSFDPSTSVAGTENINPWHTSLPTEMHDGLGINEQGQIVAAYIQSQDERDRRFPAIQHSPPFRPFPTDQPYYPHERFPVPEPIRHPPWQDLHDPRPPAHLFNPTNPVQHRATFQRRNSPSRNALQGNSATTERDLAGSQFGGGINLPQGRLASPVIAHTARPNHMRSESSGDWSQESSSRRQRHSGTESLRLNPNPNTIQSPISTSPATHSKLPYFPVEYVHQCRIDRKRLQPGYTHDLVDRDFVSHPM